MSRPEEFLNRLLYLFWAWRIGSSLCLSYSVSEAVTPLCAGTGVKVVVMVVLMSICLVPHLLPMAEFPRISLVNRIISVPSQINSIYMLNRYVGPSLDCKRFTHLLIIASVLAVVETIYLIHVDWDRI